MVLVNYIDVLSYTKRTKRTKLRTKLQAKKKNFNIF